MSARFFFQTELLVQMQRLHNSENPTLLVCATNCPWELDSAFLRRGVFSLLFVLILLAPLLPLARLHDLWMNECNFANSLASYRVGCYSDLWISFSYARFWTTYLLNIIVFERLPNRFGRKKGLQWMFLTFSPAIFWKDFFATPQFVMVSVCAFLAHFSVVWQTMWKAGMECSFVVRGFSGFPVFYFSLLYVVDMSTETLLLAVVSV